MHLFKCTKSRLSLLQTTFGMCPAHIIVFSFPLSFWFSPLSEHLDPWPCHYSALFRSSILFYRLLQTITEHKIVPTGTFLSLGLLLQGVSKTRLFLLYMPSLLFQLSTHGRRMTSTRLLKTVSTDRHEKRGVNMLTVKNHPTA